MAKMKQPFVTIIVPVYGDWPSLAVCIEALKAHVDPIHTVMFVNDCGPEADQIEQNIKQLIKSVGNFVYYRNPHNLGFVGNCNRAVLELDKTRNDILLLNSDTKVTTGFLEELLRVLYSNNYIGAVSPRSNNATLATVPLSAASQKGINPGSSYSLFLQLRSKLPPYSVVPTAHGFCMLIRRSLINRYGLFDPVFGKGYGEEVDFCQRISAHGFKSAIANRAYVFHLEAKSFTLETKAKLLEQNNKIIWRRYPNYRQSVRDYMESTRAHEDRLLRVRRSPKQALKSVLQRSRFIDKVHHAVRRLSKSN